MHRPNFCWNTELIRVFILGDQLNESLKLRAILEVITIVKALKSKIISPPPRFVRNNRYSREVRSAVTFLLFKVSRPKFQKFLFYVWKAQIRGLFRKFSLEVVYIYPRTTPTHPKITENAAFWSKTHIFMKIIRVWGSFHIEIELCTPPMTV